MHGILPTQAYHTVKHYSTQKKREEIKNRANSRIFLFLELECLVQKMYNSKV